MSEKLKWYEVREQDGVYKYGLFWMFPGKYPLYKYFLPLVRVV